MKKNINEEELAESISKTIENDLVKIQEVLDLDLKNLVDVINSLSNDKKDKVLSLIINKQLEKLIKLSTPIICFIFLIYYILKIGKIQHILRLCFWIDILKKYCFSTDLREEQFYDTLMWIALRYFAISESISYYQWKDKYEKDLKSSN